MKSFHPTTLNFLELLEHKPTTEKILSGQSEIGKSKLILRILNELCKPAPVGSKARSMKNVEKQSSVNPLVGLRFSKNHRGWGIKIFLSKWEGEVIYIGGKKPSVQHGQTVGCFTSTMQYCFLSSNFMAVTDTKEIPVTNQPKEYS